MKDDKRLRFYVESQKRILHLLMMDEMDIAEETENILEYNWTCCEIPDRYIMENILTMAIQSGREDIIEFILDGIVNFIYKTFIENLCGVHQSEIIQTVLNSKNIKVKNLFMLKLASIEQTDIDDVEQI